MHLRCFAKNILVLPIVCLTLTLVGCASKHSTIAKKSSLSRPLAASAAPAQTRSPFSTVSHELPGTRTRVSTGNGLAAPNLGDLLVGSSCGT